MANVIHRAELSKIVADRMGVSQTAAADATAAVLDNIGQALSENDRVTLTGFGTFSVKEQAARQLRAIGGENAGRVKRTVQFVESESPIIRDSPAYTSA